MCNLANPLKNQPIVWLFHNLPICLSTRGHQFKKDPVKLSISLNAGMLMEHDRYWQAKKITLLGALINLLLGVIKIIGGMAFHSHALFADGIHSLSDLLTDTMVLFASKYGSLDADDNHPYGHQRIETAATLILALFLILAGAGIAWDSLDEMIHHTHETPNALALIIAAISIAANEALFQYTHHIGKNIHSALIIANAWHHRSDAAASIIVFAGLLGSLAGLLYLDALAAVIVSAMIIKMGLSYGWNSVKELVDSAIEPEIIGEIKRTILQVPGVHKVHQLRSRMMGRDIFIDVHVLVSSYISVSEGHFIAQHVHEALVNHIQHVKDVTVHIDPEDDELVRPSLHLPNRSELEQKYLLRWHEQYPFVEAVQIHYINGTLVMDVICKSDMPEAATFYKQISQDIEVGDHPITVRVYSQTFEWVTQSP